LELEIPYDNQGAGEFTLPLFNSSKQSGRGLASVNDSQVDGTGMVDETYKSRPPSLTDRAIVAARTQTMSVDEEKRHDIEDSLSLAPSEDSTPQASTSYLGGLDHIKQLYRLSRFEVALLETDEMIKQYPTDATLYEMKGTLLERLGKRELALQSWNQSLRLDPKNSNLKHFVEKKIVSTASLGGR
jgi:Flp pilus assembly protein TadD